ncbi:MAG: TIGR03087 family PEP-CTERM/XrtA system glycosyltransferase [Gammaproteobacteria bacterium]
MKSLLLLAHRIPYPPNKGDKVRCFNILKYLSRDYRIYLGAFVDDRHDWRYREILQRYCADVFLVGISPRMRKWKSLSGIFSGKALTLVYYHHRAMAKWVSTVMRRHAPGRVVVYSSAMAQYATDIRDPAIHKIIDFVDADSQKWREYSLHHHWPLNWLYAREAKALLAFERRSAAEFDASLFVTDEEAALFRRLAPEVAHKVGYMSNGVDTEFFSPDMDYPNPYAPGDKVLVFTGAMDYWANVDAVTWFAHHVFPGIRERVAAARFYIVGARPTDAVKRLGRLSGVHVTGAVKEIRPYLFHADAAVAPLRIARGLQNKVLEAMAMAKPVLATPAAMDGIRVDPPFYDLVHDEAAVLARRAVSLLVEGDSTGLGAAGRRLVKASYAWDANLARIEALLHDRDGSSGSPSSQTGPGGTHEVHDVQHATVVRRG